MNGRTAPLLAWLAVLACTRPAEGTFVGNPELTARYRSSETRIARGGRLVAPESFLLECDGEGDTALGSASFEFRGERSDDFVQIPEGSYCGVFFVVQELTVEFDDGGAALTSVTARDFDLVVPADIQVGPGDTFLLDLADDTWLDALAQYAIAGANEVEGDPDLADAFFGGLEESTVADAPEAPDTPLEGRLDLADYPVSPAGTPTSEPDCGAGVTFDLAFPVPPAAMATIGVDGVGWCEAGLQFTADLAPLTATQLDYASLGTYTVTYNGWGEGCGALHCGQLTDDAGAPVGLPCTVLAYCDGEGGLATATGYAW
ncbi:MAG: hypothetical protein H6737_31050 [Alphaproteobacteria bacterium]|nr:hypothetical protein [Alphaproteobacteria bacterium]